MSKTVVIKLVSIKYSGDSIGNDIRVEISVLDKFITVDKKIKKGESAACNEIIGKFSVGEKFDNPEIKITVIEKDLIFNDIGGITAKLSINLESSEVQTIEYKVKVCESRSKKSQSKKCGIFDIVLEAIVSPVFGYVPGTEDGWLVVIDGAGQSFSLPSYLKVQIDSKDAKREHFIILEGVLRGQMASAKYRDNGSSFFIADNPHTAPARMTYSIFKRVFVLKGKRYLCDDYAGAPWEKGFYDVEIPDTPHQGGLNYTDKAKNPTVWFRVGHSGERYIHTGSHSLGCITVIEQKR